MKDVLGIDEGHVVNMTLSEQIIQDRYQSQNFIHVLHVDDESSILELTKQFLDMNDPSLVIESTGSAEEALKILKEQQFDCIVSDFQMPGMDGIEFAIIVKERNGTPVIIYTGRGSEEVAEAAFAAGVDDYLKKELDPSHYRVLAKRIRIAVEKHRAERALKKSEERFRGIAERSFDGIFILDLEGRITYVSPAAGRNIGYTQKELVGRYIQEFIPETDFQTIAKTFKQVMEGTYLKGIHMKFFNKEGVPLLFEVNASPIIKDGKIVGIQGIGRDITKQKKSEEALRKSEEQARSLLEFNKKVIDTAIAWIDLLDQDGNVTFWNRAAELISGYSREEVIGHKKIWEWLYPDPDYRDEIFNQAINIIEGERTENVETTIRCKNGTLKTILWCDNSILSQNGEPVGSIAIGIDITEQKMAEEALRESEEKFRDLSEQLPNMVFINKNGRVVFANEKCQEIMGYKREEFYSPGFDFLTTIAPESLDIVKRNFIKHKKGEEVDPYEYTIITKEGKRIPAILTSKLIRYEGETAILGIITDVTARLQARANIKHYNDQLEALHRHTTELGKATTLREIAESTFNAIERVLGFNHGGFAVVENDVLRFILISGINTDKIIELPLDGPGVTVRTVRTGQTQLIHNTRKDNDFIPGLAEGIYEPLSELCVPIKIDGETVVVINIESEKTNAFQEEDQRLMEIFAEHIASAIRRINERAEQRGYEERLEALHRHAIELSRTESMKEIGEITFHTIKSVLGFDLGSFMVVEGDSLRFIHTEGLETDEVFELPLNGVGITVRATKTGETQLVPDTRLDKDFILGRAEGRYHPLSELAVPVKIDSETIAVINIESTRLNSFSDGDKKLLEVFSEHVASAIKNLKQREKILASESQLRIEKDRLEILNEKLNVVGKLTRHDVRNKVAIIMSNLYLTKNLVKTREINEKLDEIQDGCEKISKILDFASTYEKLGSEELKPISVRACLNYAIGMFNLGEIELENSCDELTVHADSSLSRVFYNLIDNTLKHGGKVSKIRFHTEEKGSRIIYEDDGLGIPQDIKANLFAEKSSERGVHGLYLIRKIIESYGWTIREEGEPEKGVRFVINLPRK